MKKLFLLLLTLASTNVLFGVRPDNERTLSQITDPITDHVHREPAIAQRQAAPNADQFGRFRLMQAPQAQRANRDPAPHLIPNIFPMNLSQFNDFQLAPAPQTQRAPINIQTVQNMGTQTLPLRHNMGTQTLPLQNADTDRQQLLMDRATASAAAVILGRLKIMHN